MADFDLSGFLPYLLNQAAETTSRRFHSFYRERYGLLRTDWRVLFHLGQYGPMTAVEITERAMSHKTKVSRAAARLIEKRLVVEKRVEADRRRKILDLTDHGRRVFRDLRAQAAQYEAEITRALPAADLATLRRMLRRLSDAG